MELQDLLHVDIDTITSQKDLTFDMINDTVDTWAIKLSGSTPETWETIPPTTKSYWREYVRQMFADYTRVFNGS